ncbi:PREDICTED: RING-H2 finger protein ATL46 [Ipomoea nil]|uniref:RING-H2 finger protein ATL46 n=1 Tax=Ipomoea nil TaxID=35883 RepID=UPI000900D8FD|nr:PREDICTED: RING-H2 finger protein ATL46 [Ipomoea nil]XP_019185212.1 PREDICTED: RING-H2 finger protein ATL46 [Ipomoea nil]
MMGSMAEDREVRWVQFQRDAIFKYPPPPPSPSSSPSGNKINPAVLFIIVIVAVLFFVSGLLHLLVRFLVKNPSSVRSGRNPEVPSADDALQRQLQQLFHLHDSGVDQAFIDALPVFIYREIVGGSKEPFDCAVCLSEFVEKDKLRLLPMCGHAFHINCIDTWLLTNSTCPLCRGTLFNPGFSVENPMFDHDEPLEDPRSGDNNNDTSAQKAVDLDEIVVQKGTFPVRLGKFRKLNNGEEAEEDDGEASSSALDARRCYSMGSYQYVVGDTKLRVALNNLGNGRDVEKLVKPRDNNQDTVDGEGKRLSIGTKTDSFSISKIWLWSKKGKFGSSDSHV